MNLHQSIRLLAAAGAVLLGTWSGSSARAADEAAPNRISGLGLWLDAGALASRAKDGEAVTRWPDSSGNRFDAVYEPTIPQVKHPARPYGSIPQQYLETGHHQPPTFRAHALAGRPAVSFDANRRQTLVLDFAGHALGQDVPGFTAAFVVQADLDYGPPPAPRVEWSSNRYLFIDHLSVYNTRFAVQIETGTGRLRVSTRTLPDEAIFTFPSKSEPAPLVIKARTWHRLLTAVDYPGKTLRILLDGVPYLGHLPAGTGNRAEDVPSPITGLGSNTLGEWLSCRIAEVACYERALSPEELRGLDGYFQAKYSLGGK